MSSLRSDSYNQNPIPKARFTGIFIPVEILNISELTPTDIILLSWIDALFCEEHGGCYAKNDYLAEKLHLKDKTVSDIIAKLIKLGLVEKVGFDGRTRVIRACKEKWYQPEADSGLNRKQTAVKTGSRPRLEPEPHNIYSKEESKDKERESASGSPRKKIGSHVQLSDEEYQKLVKEHSKEKINSYIDKVNYHCEVNRGKGYSKNSYSRVINKWIADDKQKNVSSSKANLGGQRLEEYDTKW